MQQKYDVLIIKYISSVLGGFPLRPDSLMQVQVQVMKYADCTTSAKPVGQRRTGYIHTDSATRRSSL